MANQNIFVSQRSGDWSSPSSNPASPWYAPQYVALNGTPSTATPSGDSGWTVQIDHAINMDVNATVGASYQGAGWEPIPFSNSLGATATQLPDGSYRAAYQIIASNGTCSAGNSESAKITIHMGISKPRVSWERCAAIGLHVFPVSHRRLRPERMGTPVLLGDHRHRLRSVPWDLRQPIQQWWRLRRSQQQGLPRSPHP